MLTVSEQVAKVIALQNGDKVAFDAFYYQYHKLVFRNILRFIHQQEIAEDILQEVFIALWEYRAQLDPERPVDSWLFVISYNRSINWLKKNAKEKKILLHADDYIHDPEETNLQEETYSRQVHILNEAVNILPSRKKQAFRLCKLEGRSYEEVAEQLGISSETVKEYVKTSSQLIRRYIATQPASHAVLTVYVMLNF